MEIDDVYMLCVDVATRRVPEVDAIYWNEIAISEDVDRVLSYADALFATLTKKLVDEVRAR